MRQVSPPPKLKIRFDRAFCFGIPFTNARAVSRDLVISKAVFNG